MIAETVSGKRSSPSLPVEAHTAEQRVQQPPTNIQMRGLRDEGSVLVEWISPDEAEEGEVSVGFLFVFI